MTSLFVSPKVLDEPSDDKLAWAAGLHLIGATRTADVLAAAVSMLAEAPPEADSTAPNFDEADDDDGFYTFLNRYDPRNEDFYRLMDEEVYPLAAAYVRANTHEFVR